MTKESFQRIIQRQACTEGSRAKVAWNASIKISKDDKRWAGVCSSNEEIAINEFANCFGVDLPEEPVYHFQQSKKSDNLKKVLAKDKANLEKIKKANPKFVPEALKGIKELEARIERTLKEEAEEE